MKSINKETMYYENLRKVTDDYNCGRCAFGMDGNCCLECKQSFEEYQKEQAEYEEYLKNIPAPEGFIALDNDEIPW